MLKQLRSSFSKDKSNNSTRSVTKAPTPISNKAPTPTSAVSITKQLRKARSLYEEGVMAYDQGRYDSSLFKLQEAVQIQELSLGKYHDETIRSYWRLGRAACKSEKPKKLQTVLQAFQRAARMGEGKVADLEYQAMLQDMKDCYQHGFLLAQPKENNTISTSGSASVFSDNISVCSSNSSDEKDAAFLQKLHQDPMKHMVHIFELEKKGDAFMKKKQYKKASLTYSQALQIQDALVGEDSLCGADIRCKLALCFLRQDQIPQARRALQMAYTTFVAQVGNDHPATLGAVARMKKIAMTTSTRSLTSMGTSTQSIHSSKRSIHSSNG